VAIVPHAKIAEIVEIVGVVATEGVGIAAIVAEGIVTDRVGIVVDTTTARAKIVPRAKM
jgi:hypothetical protein